MRAARNRRLLLLLFIVAVVLLSASPVSAATSVRVDESTNYVDNNSSDVDSHANHGTFSSFAAEQSAPDSVFDTLTEAFTGTAGTNYQDFVDQISDLHPEDTDIGTHSSFPEEQDYDLSYDTLTESASSGGATPDIEYNENLAETSLASVTWTNRATITIAPPSGTINYLVLAMCEIRASTAAYRAMARVQKADTTTMTQVEYYPQDTTDYVSFFSVFYESVANPSTLLIDLDYACSSASETMYIRDARLIAIELTSAATEDEDLTRISKTTASYSDVSTITVSAGSYLLFSSMVFDGSSSSYSTMVRLYGDTGASALQEDLIEMVASGSAARHSFAAVRYVTPTESNTYSNEYMSENVGNTAGCAYSHIIAVPIACFNNIYYASATGSSTPSVANTWETKVSNSYTSLAADHLIIGTGQYRAASSSYSASERLYYNGGTTDNDAMREDKDSADWYSHCMFTKATLTAGSHEDRIQMWMETGATSSDFQQAWLFSLELRTNIVPCDLDLEVGWVAAQYSESNEYLCIYGGTQDAEALSVDFWNPSGSAWVTVIADLAVGWNNVSVTTYLIDATMEIRFIDTTGGDDTSAGTWQVDGVLLHCWTVAVTNYELDLEFQWTTADYDETEEYLCIYGGTMDAENIKVDVRSGSNWVNIVTDLTGSSWYNVSIGSYLTSGTITFRFLGGTETTDPTQSTWQIDSNLIHVYSTNWTQPMSEGITLADSYVKVGDFSRTYSEGVTLADSVSFTKAMSIVLSESLTAAEVVVNVANFVIVLLEGIAVAEVCIAQMPGIEYQKFLSEVMTIAESPYLVTSAARTLSEGITVADSITKAATFTRTYSEGMTLADAVSLQKMFQATLSEEVVVADSLTRAAVIVRTYSEGITLADSISLLKLIQKTLSEGITVADTLTRTAAISRTLYETITLERDTIRGLNWLTLFEQIILMHSNPSDLWARPTTTLPNPRGRPTVPVFITSPLTWGQWSLISSLITTAYIYLYGVPLVKQSRHLAWDRREHIMSYWDRYVAMPITHARREVASETFAIKQDATDVRRWFGHRAPKKPKGKKMPVTKRLKAKVTSPFKKFWKWIWGA